MMFDFFFCGCAGALHSADAWSLRLTHTAVSWDLKFKVTFPSPAHWIQFELKFYHIQITWTSVISVFFVIWE